MVVVAVVIINSTQISRDISTCNCYSFIYLYLYYVSKPTDITHYIILFVYFEQIDMSWHFFSSINKRIMKEKQYLTFVWFKTNGISSVMENIRIDFNGSQMCLKFLPRTAFQEHIVQSKYFKFTTICFNLKIFQSHFNNYKCCIIGIKYELLLKIINVYSLSIHLVNKLIVPFDESIHD